MKAVFQSLEPYAMDLWQDGIEVFLPVGMKPASLVKQTYFGGLYQKLIVVR